MSYSADWPRTVVFAMCGSFCTFETVLPQVARLRARGWEVLPLMSYSAATLDTRFGRAADWKRQLEDLTGHQPMEDLRQAAPLGPRRMASGRGSAAGAGAGRDGAGRFAPAQKLLFCALWPG